MREAILDPVHEQILRDERRLLAEVRSALDRHGLVPDDHRTALAESVAQLDELFLLVVVGEFNAGKSALINALLGRRVLAEGVTPTTSSIHRLAYGDEPRRESQGAGLDLIAEPLPILRHLNIVDTPGTNAIDRRHEALTSHFVPRSDLVIFVTSADRPFAESERVFLERIRRWGKKVVVVVNKVDILPTPEDAEEVRRYVAEHARTLLGVDPPVFLVSAARALGARESGDEPGLIASGLPALEHALVSSLDEAERLRLKLLNPLGVAEHVVAAGTATIRSHLELLHDDLTTVADIDAQMTRYAGDVRREFELRLADMDNVLHRLEKRGLEFFDDTLRLGRLGSLFNREALRDDFVASVVADAPHEIETRTEAMIDWLVESDLNQWQAVVAHVNRRSVHHRDRMVGEVGRRFELDRASLLDTVGRAARHAMAGYDRDAEARRLAEDVRKAVAGTALVEVGAVGLGATVAYLAGSTAADATGLLAAGVLAAIGLFILPDRRRRAKRQLKDKVGELRTEIMSSMTAQFERAADRSQAKVRDTIAPYTRFVAAERDRLETSRSELSSLASRMDELRSRIESAARR